MVDETIVYCDTLNALALEKAMLCLDTITLRFTIDAISTTIL